MKRWIAAALVAVFGISMTAPAAMAKANEKRAHQVAIGSTAAAAYLLSKKKTRTTGLVVAGASAYAWKKHHDAVKQRHKIEARRKATARRSVKSAKKYKGGYYDRAGKWHSYKKAVRR
jgi:hypothetical protein